MIFPDGRAIDFRNFFCLNNQTSTSPCHRLIAIWLRSDDGDDHAQADDVNRHGYLGHSEYDQLLRRLLVRESRDALTVKM